MQLIQCSKANDLKVSVTIEPFDPCQAEKALLCGILERAIVDILWPKYGDDRQTKWEALRWVMDNTDPPSVVQPFTFRWICQHLEIDSTKIRREIRRMRDGLRQYKRTKKNAVHRHYPPIEVKTA